MAVKKKSIRLSWKPVRRGAIYCAPACGYECTWREYQSALRRADSMRRLLEKAFPLQWKARVHENMGWHYGVVSSCGRLKVSGCNFEIASFTAFLGDANFPGGTWAEHGTTPLEAVRNVIKMAREDLESVGAVLKDFEVVK
jgi:hypothetical protein